MMEKKAFVPFVVLFIVAVVLIGGGIWYYASHQSIKSTANNTNTTPVVPTSRQPTSTAWSPQAYTNTLLGYQVTYPAEWRIAGTYMEEMYLDMHQTTTFPGIQRSDIVAFTDLKLPELTLGDS